jgi:hypothetical protein
MAVSEFLIGTSVVLTATVTTPEGTPENPTGILLTVEQPDGTFRDSEGDLVVNIAAAQGKASCTFMPVQVGVYAYRWEFSGFPGGAAEGLFRIRPSAIAGD